MANGDSRISVIDWNRHWATVRLANKKPQRDLARIVRSVISEGKILEVGIGRGYLLNHLSRDGYDAHGVDLSDASIDLAAMHKVLVSARTRFVQADARRLSYRSHEFDLVFSQGLLEHFEADERRSLLEEQKRVTRPGGYVVVDVPVRRDGSSVGVSAFGVEYRFTPNEVAAMGAGVGMEIVATYYRDYERPLNLLRMLHDNKMFVLPQPFNEWYESIGRRIDKWLGPYVARQGGAVFRK